MNHDHQTSCDGPNDIAGCNEAVDRIKTAIEEIARMVAGLGRWGGSHVLWEEHYDKAERHLMVKATTNANGKHTMGVGSKATTGEMDDRKYAVMRRRAYNTLMLRALMTLAGEVKIVTSDGAVSFLHDAIRDGKFGTERVVDRIRARMSE